MDAEEEEKINKENNRKAIMDEMKAYDCNLETGFSKLHCELEQ